jgi:hypothetical protein
MPRLAHAWAALGNNETDPLVWGVWKTLHHAPIETLTSKKSNLSTQRCPKLNI